MKTWVRKTLSVGVLAAGALLFAPGAAHADVSQDTSDNNGILNGTQIVAPFVMPVNIVGNSDAVLGHSNAAGLGVNWITEGGHSHRRGVSQHSSDNNGILNGTQFYLPFDAPLNIVGNSDAVLGHSNAAGVGVNGRRTEGAHTTGGHHVGQDTSDNNGILNGTQIYAPFSMPVNLAGNSDALLLGHSNAAAVAHNESGHGGGIGQDTSDNNGILNGTQIYEQTNIPIDI
jgi:hypothetical protein